ncbi:MAG: HEAT repeat domain-containing protein [Bdellovibrionales bacterium]|nr:HEAT repeat domain-containing protein [Bdellovibrionales bacterium]
MKRTLQIALFVLITACSSGASVDELVMQLKDADPDIRNNAAIELALKGEDAKTAVYPLSRLLLDDNDGVRSAASYALRKIGTHDAIRVINAHEIRGMRS